jgi:hypothetical protein
MASFCELPSGFELKSIREPSYISEMDWTIAVPKDGPAFVVESQFRQKMAG